MFVRIPKDFIIRLMNFSSLAVVYLGYLFSLSYEEKLSKHPYRCIKVVPALLLGIQLIIYDPFVQYKMYFMMYPDMLSIGQITEAMQMIHRVTVLINMGLILFSMFQLCLTYRKVYYLHFLRSYLVGEGICYILIMLSYMLICWFAPAFLVKISKIANYKMYLSIPLSDNQIIYTAFPYYLVITTLLCAFCIYEVSSVKKKMKMKTFTITKQIDAADTTSKVFCHYMKNELLAIESEIEMLEVTEENKEDIKDVIDRCNNLYQRLDVIHRSTKRSELNLVETDMKIFTEGMIRRMKGDFHQVNLQTEIEEAIPNVMIDPNYLEQAINNIIENAIDSMEKLPKENRNLTIGLSSIGSWIVLKIQDSGVGISRKNMKNIFTPLYSSKPIKNHWGIGLALTHRIIMAHDGKIEVESEVNVGTTFRILLPNLNQYVS
ncbi:periplasmic sensor signal transduction histidine kinase [Lachnospiraceae bacterium KM106-2]|nr:periplasmic sensor signal transduction histidine kinase [Lachnospiraceae bacterium KM106-2]